MTSRREQGVIFECQGSRLVGIIAKPEQHADTAVLILVGGPQYRAGSHRLFTSFARSLAEAGIVSMRFDFRGMGDSEGERAEFDSTEDDIAAAIDALCKTVPSVRRVVLLGLCDAASSALMIAHRHARVAGLVLLNPWVHTGVYSPQVKLAHYYRPSLSRKDQWRRLLSGDIRLVPAFSELARDTLALVGRMPRRQPEGGSFIESMLQGLGRFQHGVLIVLSEADLTAREFSTLVASNPDWKAATASPAVSIEVLAGADHTFSTKPWKEALSRLTIDWLRRL